MKRVRATVFLLGSFAAAVSAPASTLKVSFEHHLIVVNDGGKRHLLETVFTDEPLVAKVHLDVYTLPQLPASSTHLADLRRLSRTTWWQHLTWRIKNDSGRLVDIRPKVLSAAVRERGPEARNAADRDASVACTSYEGAFELGPLPPGNYSIGADVEGVEAAAFPLAVRTGSEPEVRDVYLQEKARQARNWSQFKSLELERIRLDPTKAAALLDLAHRSLDFGTLEETNAYFDRAARTMQQNVEAWAKLNSADAAKQRPQVDKTVKEIRALQNVLPEYFENRTNWRVTLDAGSGQYVITTRDTNRVVRVVR